MRRESSPQVLGRYEIYGKIASGGMASVHFGRLLGGAGFARTVAIKRLHPHLAEDPAFCASIIDEARLVARIHHPNVVPTLDVVADEGELLLVMEYVRGESLAQAMMAVAARGERIPLAIVSAVAVGALSGLHAAHDATSDTGSPLGIVHRDVSPQNILVGTDGLARVIDFGVAKAAGRVQTTREGVVKGKFAYMAPEHLGARRVTRTADVYAMGVVLWEMLTCRRLFDGADEAELMGSLMAGAKDPPSVHCAGVPSALDALVMKALASEAASRYPTARAMAEELASIVSPALPAEVGAWCAEIAKESLAKRAAAVAEIESSGSASVPLVSSKRAPDQAASAATKEKTEITSDDDVAPTIASQPASLSPRAPPPVTQVRSRRSLAIAGGSLLLVAVVLLRWSPWTTPTEPVEAPTSAAAVAVPTTAETTTPAAEPPSMPSAAPSNPPLASATASSLPAPPVPVPAATAPSRPTAPRAVSTCNPPYEFDAHGKKKWKRQCL